MEWLQEHIRKHLAESHAESNVLNLRPQPSQAEDLGDRAVGLVERAIQHIRDVEQEAVARHARAETLARDAIQELNKAQERVRAAEAARWAAESCVDGATAKLREMEMQLERMAANAAAARTKIAAAEGRARDTEKRAAEAEKALERIETVIQTLLLEKRLSVSEVAA
jgi:chromosome segregation ATPase